MEHVTLVRYLAETAADLVEAADQAGVDRALEMRAEAAELFTLAGRIAQRGACGQQATETVCEEIMRRAA
ncbi:MAG: hypothetical protein ACPGNT_07415 [Rhodospirillales bacterium]